MVEGGTLRRHRRVQTSIRPLWYLVAMNELFSPAQQRPTTQTADGLPRWRWTVAEIERMTAAGYFHDYDRFELLGGEIVPMSRRGGDTKSSG